MNSIYTIFNIKVQIKTNSTIHQNNKGPSQQCMARVLDTVYWIFICFCQRNQEMGPNILGMQEVSQDESLWVGNAGSRQSFSRHSLSTLLLCPKFEQHSHIASTHAHIKHVIFANLIDFLLV